MNKRDFQTSFKELPEALSSRLGRKTSVSQVNRNNTVTHYDAFECPFCLEENLESANQIRHSYDCLHTKIKNIKEDLSTQIAFILDVADSSYDYDGGGWSSCHFCGKDAWCRDGSGSTHFVDKIKHKKDCPQVIAWGIVKKFKLNPPPTQRKLTPHELREWNHMDKC